MARRYRRETEGGDVSEVMLPIVTIYVGYLVLLYYTNRNNFWNWVIYGVVAVLSIFAVSFLFLWLNERRKRNRMERMIVLIKNAGLEESFNNFIIRFGRGQEKTKDAWEYRNYKIDWNRINEVMLDFRQKGVSLSHKDFNALLRHYIDKRENNITLGSIQSTVRDFNMLNGPDFERLLQLLYEKMGYTVQLSGRVGDQGGDLVATNGQERLLIQAKCYKNIQVGNDAVQQAVAAKSYYDCGRAAVVTTSNFTREAVELAKANNVELVGKTRLQELLLQYLAESWN